MQELPKQLRHLAKAVDKRHYALAQRKDDGQVAINEFARMGRQLLEMGLTVLGEVPELDLAEVEASVLAVRASLRDRLADSPEFSADLQRRVRVLRFGGISVTVERAQQES
ncbi:hypothetical protein [Amycolatopsis sp. GM8]|uniref:hypothetical protein n=1 Tax=Amycolatopsis sp. GM8 TaxID=2896530 RepID=UPI001F2EAA69|nr:hypothetical protein [Amycolatopsis sp. GM8]